MHALHGLTCAGLLMGGSMGWPLLRLPERNIVIDAVASEGRRPPSPKSRVKQEALVMEGGGAYFTLRPGRVMVYEGNGERREFRVLDQTHEEQGVVARVVEARCEKFGEWVVSSRNFVAMEPGAGVAYYFGSIAEIETPDGTTAPAGGWMYGAYGVPLYLFSPFTWAWPGPIDRDGESIVCYRDLMHVAAESLSDRVETKAGVFENCLRLRRWGLRGREHGTNEWYAPGVGLVKDERSEIELVRLED